MEAMSWNLGFPEQAYIKSVDFQFLLGPDRRILLASRFVARCQVVALLIPGEDLEREFVVYNRQYHLSRRSRIAAFNDHHVAFEYSQINHGIAFDRKQNGLRRFFDQVVVYAQQLRLDIGSLLGPSRPNPGSHRPFEKAGPGAEAAARCIFKKTFFF